MIVLLYYNDPQNPILTIQAPILLRFNWGGCSLMMVLFGGAFFSKAAEQFRI